MLLQLFLSFLQVGMFSIGGGYAAMPFIQAQAVVQHEWLTMQEFGDLITIAEMTPGPITVNSATFVGMRIAGLPGALAATFGCVLPSCIIVSVMALVYQRFQKGRMLQSILMLMRPVIVALIVSAGVSLFCQAVFPQQGFQPVALALFAAAFVLLRTCKKISPILIMLLCGAVQLLIGLI